MSTPAPRTDWSAASKLLHWLVAVLILVMAWLGLTMGDLPNGPDKIATYALHKSIGLTVLGLALLRLLARCITHVALYALLLALPLTGWLLNSAAGFPLQWFGLVNLPSLAARDEALHALSVEAHELLFWAMATLVVLHAAAAFHHHLFLRDATLSRMLPRGRRRPHDAPETP